jgi:TRAP-type C4-dicarboxylate transport system permease large subunit
MPIAILALAVFIAVVIFWNVIVKRNIGEAMGLGLLAAALFAGREAPAYLAAGFLGALNHEVLYAALGFVFMAYLVEKTGLIDKILAILNSAFRHVKGGPAYVDTVGSGMLGALSGSNSANTAAGGAFTGPWMVRTGWSRTRAATVLAGNGGLGAALPPSASMVIMIGFAGDLVTTAQVYLALLSAGLYQVIHRVILVRYFVLRDKIPATPPEAEIPPFRESLKAGAGALTIFLGPLIPISVTIGPLANFLETSTPLGDSLRSISLLIWIPVLMTMLALIAGRSSLPSTLSSWRKLLDGAMPRFATIGALLFFAIAASEVLAALGLAEDVQNLIEIAPLGTVAMVVLVGLLVTIVAGPLTSTSTLTALGQVSLFALVGVGVDPLAAVIAILMFASTEGASPPASGSIFVASGLTGARPETTFIPLMIYYVFPIFTVACLVGLGILPIWRQ